MARRSLPPDAELMRTLDDLARHVVVPDATVVGLAVRARLAGADRHDGSAGPPSRRLRTRVLACAAVAALLVSAVLALSSTTRDAVAELFGLRGVEIGRLDGPIHVPAGRSLSLGARVGLDEASRRVDFDVALPRGSDLGTPDGVYVSDIPDGGRVTLVFAPSDRLPVTGTTGVGLLLTEFRAGIPDAVVRKQLAAGTGAELVTVDGGPAFWISGEPHVLTLVDEHGRFFEDQARLAGNTLLWQRGDLTYRLESALSRDEAIAIADSVRRRGRAD